MFPGSIIVTRKRNNENDFDLVYFIFGKSDDFIVLAVKIHVKILQILSQIYFDMF